MRNLVTTVLPKHLSQSAFYVLLGCLSFSLSGCGLFFGDEGVFRNRENDYLKADNIPPLVLPPGKHSAAMGELYPVPPISATDFGYDPSSAEFEVPRPMPISANLQEENVKIQRVGGESWILLNISAGEVWPRIRNFLNVNGLLVDRADISKGVIETGWLQFKTNLATRDRYRLQIDQGVQPESTEIHILHMSVPSGEVPKGAVSWPVSSVDPEREKWLMDELAATLASDPGGGGTSLLAQAIGGSSKASLGMLRGEPIMTINLDKVRTFATLNYSVKQDGFTLFEADTDTQVNSEMGLYYVHYRNPEETKPGWFKRLLHIGLNPKAPTSPYSLGQLKSNMLVASEFENPPFSNVKKEKVLPKAPGYLIVVTGTDGDYLVRVRDAYGKRLTTHNARELLTILRKNLI